MRAIAEDDHVRPLLSESEPSGLIFGTVEQHNSIKACTHEFLAGRGRKAAQIFEIFTAFLIVLNVCMWVLSTDPAYRSAQKLYDDVQAMTVLIFSVEYVARWWSSTADPAYGRLGGALGRLRWTFSFWSLVDLVSIVPFIVCAVSDCHCDSTVWLRIFRLFRDLRTYGGYQAAFDELAKILSDSRHLLITSSYVGFSVCLILSSMYYLAEKDNPAMVYGQFDSIVSSSYFALMNLFGEFPLVNNHNSWGKVIGVISAVIGVALFSIPIGVLGAGFEEMYESRRQEDVHNQKPPAQNNFANAGIAESELSEERTRNIVRSRVSRFLLHKTASGKRFMMFIYFLIVLDVLAFMLSTVDSITAISGVDSLFDLIEVFSVAVFTVEWSLRAWVAQERLHYRGCYGLLRYAFTFYSIVDLGSILPFYVNLIAHGTIGGSTFVRMLRLMRLFKSERYAAAFQCFGHVLSKNASVLAVTGFTSCVLWIFFASLLYWTEGPNTSRCKHKAQNWIVEYYPNGTLTRNPWSTDTSTGTPLYCLAPDPSTLSPGQRPADFLYYRTVGSSMWITLLNLTGECPEWQYSVLGKIITAFIGFVAVGIFSVPMGLLGAGFQDWVMQQEKMEQESAAAVPNIESTFVHTRTEVLPAKHEHPHPDGELNFEIGPHSSLEDRVFYFVSNLQNGPGFWFNVLIFTLICLTTLEGILDTVDTIKKNDAAGSAFDWFEGAAVVVFCIEWLLRIFAAAADPKLRRHGSAGARLCFAFGFFSIIDLIAIVPWFLAKASPGGWWDAHDAYLRMLRMLRLLRLDEFMERRPLEKLQETVMLHSNALVITSAAAAVLWLIFASILYLCMHNAPAYQHAPNGTVTQDDRYESVPSALSFTLIHLSGDFPLVDYDFWAKVTLFFGCIFAVGVVAVPSGLLADGFSDVLEDTRNEEKKLNWAVLKVQARVRAWLIRSRRGVGRQRCSVSDEWQYEVHRFVTGATFAGRVFERFVVLLVIANIAMVLLETEPSILASWGQHPFDIFECFSVIVFTLEFAARLYCAPKGAVKPRKSSRSAARSRWGYLTSFFGVADILAIAPWWVEIIFWAGDPPHATVFRVFRVFRVLELEHFLEAFTLLDDAFRECSATLAATGLLGAMIWIGCATLFYIFEKNNDNVVDDDGNHAFRDLPNSLYMVAIFLGGEWGQIDFTVPGKVVCIFLCVAGIALYAIPVAAIFDAFQSMLSRDEDDEEDGS
eukprot:g1188.t1